jgi:hypothetical protein
MSYRLRHIFALALLACPFGLSAAPPDSPNTRANDVATGTQLITPQKLKMHLKFIASDELEGRDTPSRGLDLAARYLSSQLEYYGYEPAGDNGTFYQTIHMSRRRASKSAKLTVASGDQRVEFGHGVDFVGSGGEVKGDLVFAGYGITSKETGYDDYASLDVKGKVVVVFDGVPEGVDPNVLRVGTRGRGARGTSPKMVLAQQRGAVGLITLKGPEFTTSNNNRPSPFESRVAAANNVRSVLDYLEVDRAMEVEMTAAAAAKLEDFLRLNFAEIRGKIAQSKKPVAAPVSATVQGDLSPEIVERMTTQNVCALLEGSDPQLKDEIVLFSAHYDHIGVSNAQAAPGAPKVDRIFNGADDDGSGTVGILTMAEAYAAIQRPRRSLLFVWHAGEERGLQGSAYYVQRPTRPLDKIVANINIDMIGRNSDDKPENNNHVFIIGARRTSQELIDIVYKTNADRMKLDETDNGNYFMRSDHFNYARKRIPVVFFFTGVHKDYHKVTDEVDLIQFDKMKKILGIIFEVGLELANRDGRPAFTGQGF